MAAYVVRCARYLPKHSSRQFLQISSVGQLLRIEALADLLLLSIKPL